MSKQLIEKIKDVKAKKNATILAHYYEDGDIQDIADFVGDSYYLAQKGQASNSPLILLAGDGKEKQTLFLAFDPPLMPSQKRAEHLEQWKICERYKQVLCYVEKFRGKKAIQTIQTSFYCG